MTMLCHSICCRWYVADRRKLPFSKITTNFKDFAAEVNAPALYIVDNSMVQDVVKVSDNSYTAIAWLFHSVKPFARILGRRRDWPLQWRFGNIGRFLLAEVSYFRDLRLAPLCQSLLHWQGIPAHQLQLINEDFTPSQSRAEGVSISNWLVSSARPVAYHSSWWYLLWGLVSSVLNLLPPFELDKKIKSGHILHGDNGGNGDFILSWVDS